MTRKDYVLIAAAIKGTRIAMLYNKGFNEIQLEATETFSKSLTDILIRDLYEDNNRFDAQKFMEATGTDQSK